MTLCTKVVNFIRFQIENQIRHPLAISQITVMKKKLCISFMRITVNVINSLSVERATSPNDSVNFVSFIKKKFRKVRTVLSGDSRD